MSEQELLKVIGANIKLLLTENNMTQQDLANALGISQGAISHWLNGAKSPRMDKIDAMCKIFNCSRTDILQQRSTDEGERLAQELKDNPKYRMLLRTASELSPEDFDFLTAFAEKLKNK